MLATRREDWINQLNQKTHEERIWLNLILISKLFFKNLNIISETLPNDVFMGSDFSLTFFLLNILKQDMDNIKFDISAKKALFGDTDSNIHYDALMHNINTALNAYAQINKTISCQNIEDTIGPLFCLSIIVTACMALFSTIMPWFIPVALVASTFLFAAVTGELSNHYLDKADTLLTHINVQDKETATQQAEKCPGRLSFFTGRFFQHAVRKIGEDKTVSLREKRNPNTPIYHPKDANTVKFDMSATMRVTSR